MFDLKELLLFLLLCIVSFLYLKISYYYLSNEKTKKNAQYPPLHNGAVSTRYFFVCTLGKNPNGTIGFNNFDVKTTDGYPTFKMCIELSNENFPNMYDVILISISEISPEDWKVFLSEQ